MFEQKINPEKFFLRDICYLRDTAKAFLHETSASNNKAFDGHSAIQLLANDRFMDRSLGGRSANFAQDPLTCHRPAMSAHLHHCSRAVRQVTASSRRNQPFGFISKLRHWTNGLQRRMAPVDGIGGPVSVGLGGRLCIIMGGWFEQHTHCVAAQSPCPVAPLSPSRLPSKGP